MFSATVKSLEKETRSNLSTFSVPAPVKLSQKKSLWYILDWDNHLQVLLSCQLLEALRGLAKILTAVGAHFGHWQLKEHLPRATRGGLQVTQWLSGLWGLVGGGQKSPLTPVQGLGLQRGCSGPYGDQLQMFTMVSIGWPVDVRPWDTLGRSLGLLGWWVWAALALVLWHKAPEGKLFLTLLGPS